VSLFYTITSYSPAVGGAQAHAHRIVSMMAQQFDVRTAAFWHTNRTDWLLGTTLRAPTVGESYAPDGVPVSMLRLSRIDRRRALLPTLLYYLRMRGNVDALAACQVLCVPSIQESFGGVYTEAWSFGKPVIGARIPAVTDVIDDGVDGFLVEQHPAEIADRIVLLLEDESAAQCMGAAGKAKVVRRYTWDVIAQRTLAAYRSVM